MYDPLLVKETNQHRLQFAFLGLGYPGSSIAKIAVLSLVVSINDAFIACDDVQEDCGIVYHSFLQFLTDRYSTVFLILGQQTHSVQNAAI